MSRGYIVATFVVIIACILAISLRNVDENARKGRMPYIIQMNRSEKPAEYPSLEAWYDAIFKKVSPSGEMLYMYGTVLDGFAATLSIQEAAVMRKKPGCLAVISSSLHQLHITRSPDFLSIPLVWSEYHTQGEDIIIGVIDTGIWPESKSFNDEGLHGIPKGWSGICDAGEDLSFKCNKKIIGARYYRKGFEKHYRSSTDLTEEIISPRDSKGHGTHIASIAAGVEVINVDSVYAGGTARGMAPRARLAIYKACWNRECDRIDQLKAIDDAVADGVHIISMSIGSPDEPFYEDEGIVTVAEFGAMKKGVLVSASAGNTGPDRFTLSNTAPWITTAGAGSIDRDFPASVKLGNGKKYEGTSTYKGDKKSIEAPLVYASASKESRSCLGNSLKSDVVKGKIVLCDRLKSKPWEKGNEVGRAGGVGIIVANDAQRGAQQEITNLNIPPPNDVPSISVNFKDGESIKKYINGIKAGTAEATIQITGEARVRVRAPLVAAFSSRGPSEAYPFILKPDLIAPGVNILGAIKDSYEFMSGTSMACPHVSGVAALIKAKNPHWTPAAIKSALMTSSRWYDNTGQAINDSYSTEVAKISATGAGRISPEAAMDPGLVYDMSSQDYINFFCSLPDFKKYIARLGESCPVPSSEPTDLNYPSFYVSFESGKESVQEKSRTVTYVGRVPSVMYSWSVRKAVDGVEIKVDPEQLNFSNTGEEAKFTVTFKNTKKLKPSNFGYGEIMWRRTGGKTLIIRTPVIVK